MNLSIEKKTQKHFISGDEEAKKVIGNALSDVVNFCQTWGDVDEFDFVPPEKLTSFIDEQLKRLAISE